MHRKANSDFRKYLSVLVTVGIALALLVPMADSAKATPIDASIGLDFGNDGIDILEDAPVGSSHTYRDVINGVDAVVTVIELTNSHNDVTDKIDDEPNTVASEDVWIRSDIKRKSGTPDGDYTVNGFRIDFESTDVSNNTTRVELSGLRLNAYDIDNRQFVQVSNVDNYQLTSNTIVNSVVNLGNNTVRFTANATGASTTISGSNPVHSHGEARVQINFLTTSSLTIKMGILNSTGSQEFDFSTSGVAWQDASGPISAPAAVSPPAPASSGSAPAPVKQHVQTLNQTPAPGQSVAMFGAHFGGITEAFVGGLKVEILSKTENRIDIRMPIGLSGELDVELKSPLGTLILPKHFTMGKVAAAGTRKATLIVGGFAHNSRVLTPRMKARIDKWLAKHSDLSTLTCTGFTSLPRRTTDVALSTNRGKTACSYSESERPEIESSVSQGIEDPRPGLNVRRVRLVLTP